MPRKIRKNLRYDIHYLDKCLKLKAKVFPKSPNYTLAFFPLIRFIVFNLKADPLNFFYYLSLSLNLFRNDQISLKHEIFPVIFL